MLCAMHEEELRRLAKLTPILSRPLPTVQDPASRTQGLVCAVVTRHRIQTPRGLFSVEHVRQT